MSQVRALLAAFFEWARSLVRLERPAHNRAVTGSNPVGPMHFRSRYGMDYHRDRCSASHDLRVRAPDNEDEKDQISKGCEPYHAVPVQCRGCAVGTVWNAYRGFNHYRSQYRGIYNPDHSNIPVFSLQVIDNQ